MRSSVASSREEALAEVDERGIVDPSASLAASPGQPMRVDAEKDALGGEDQEVPYMQSNNQGRGQFRRVVGALAGVLWLACDGESVSSTPAVVSVPAPSENVGASSTTPRGRVVEPATAAPESSNGRPAVDESIAISLPVDEWSHADEASGVSVSVDAGAPEGSARADAGVADAGGSPVNDCCTESAQPGCAEAPVLECVCAGDAACCSESYDALCVAEAITRCARVCGAPPPESDCTTPSDVPSCSVPEIAECVCALDPFCCTFRFDANCVTLAGAECGVAQPRGQGTQP